MCIRLRRWCLFRGIHALQTIPQAASAYLSSRRSMMASMSSGGSAEAECVEDKAMIGAQVVSRLRHG